MRLVHRLLLHLFYFSVMGLLTSLLVAWLGWAGGFGLMLLFWIPSIWAVPALYGKMTRREMSLNWVAILAVVISIYGVARYFPNLTGLVASDAAAGIRPSEIRKYPGTLSFTFRDARVQQDFALERKVKTSTYKGSGSTTSYFMAAPLTDSAWTKQDTVWAWVVCRDNYGACSGDDKWSVQNRAGVIALAESREEFRETARLAAEKYGLVAAPGALLLTWCATPGTEIRSRATGYWFSVFGVYGIWALLYSIRYPFRKNKEDE